MATTQARSHSVLFDSTAPWLLDEHGFAPIHYSAASGDVPLLSSLFKNGKFSGSIQFHPDLVDGEGNTPLHHAVQRGQIEAVTFLLSEGCSPNAQNLAFETPVDLAARLKSPEILRLLLAQPNVSKDAQDANGNTPLMTSCLSKNVETANVLIDMVGALFGFIHIFLLRF